MIDLRSPHIPRAARVPCRETVESRGYLDLCDAYDIAPGLGGSALEPEHETAPPPRSQADAVTVAPCRGAAR